MMFSEYHIVHTGIGMIELILNNYIVVKYGGHFVMLCVLAMTYSTIMNILRTPCILIFDDFLFRKV